MGAADRYPEPYLEFLVLFHGERDYFECHEVLEEYWQKERRGGDAARARLWAGLIQIAVALYHERRGNAAGARKLLKKAAHLLETEDPGRIGLDREELKRRIGERMRKLDGAADGTADEEEGRKRSGGPPGFRDLDLPFSDPKLEEECRRRCRERGFEWGAPSRMDRVELVHRHSVRDRTEVLERRREALERKALRRPGPER